MPRYIKIKMLLELIAKMLVGGAYSENASWNEVMSFGEDAASTTTQTLPSLFSVVLVPSGHKSLDIYFNFWN